MVSRQPLTSLMKQKFGVTRSSTMKFSEKDTLYTLFRKLANYIYKNGDWTEQDEKAAVETMIRNHEHLPLGTTDTGARTIEVYATTPEEKRELGKKYNQSMSPYTAVVRRETEAESEKAVSHYVLLDRTNKVGSANHNRHWWLNVSNTTLIKPGTKKTYGFGDISRAIGYDKLVRDIMKVFKEKEKHLTEQGVTEKELQRFLHQVIDPAYAGKKWTYLFTKIYWGELTAEQLRALPRDESPKYWAIPPELSEDMAPLQKEVSSFQWQDLRSDPTSRNKLNLDEAPYLIPTPSGAGTYAISPKQIEKAQKQNVLLTFVQNYLEDSYDMILQQEYEKTLDHFTRASAWQTKKQINQETEIQMNETTLKKFFGFVELDNDVDLTLFQKFEAEMNEVYPLLPQVETKPALRLRKLGNYHALGLYHPASNTIAIDFRGPEDQKNRSYVPSESGIQSFVHEYAHFLDYNFREDGQLMSMQPEFREIVSHYRENLQRLDSASPIKKKAAYYTAPSEVFARAFELYTSMGDLQTNFLKASEVYKMQEDYQCFDDTIHEKVTRYFNQLFPSYLEKAQEFLQQEIPHEKKEGVYTLKELKRAVSERENGVFEIPDSQMTVTDQRYFDLLDFEEEGELICLSTLEPEHDYFIFTEDTVIWRDNWSGEDDRIYEGDVQEQVKFQFFEESFEVHLDPSLVTKEVKEEAIQEEKEV